MLQYLVMTYQKPKDLMAMDCTGDFSVEAVDTVQSVGDEGCGDI